MEKKSNVMSWLKKMCLLVLILVLVPFALSAQEFSITGTVTDSDGLGIPGVNIVIKGTTTGTITDFDGNYVLNLSDKNVILVYSFIGYQSKNITVANQRVLNVTLTAETELLDDVVVVGYGKQTKKSVVGSIVQAKGEELLKAGNVSSVSQALQGLLPGVTIQQDAGMPGSTQGNILIRGQSTWTNNDPLYIVDGVERDFNNIDPNEIESISVLKDASATAVYGLKAANGVIVITTKSGKIGKTQINFSSTWGIKIPSAELEYETDYSKVLEYQNVASINDYNYSSQNQQSLIDSWRDPNRNPDYYTYTILGNELLGTGQTEQYNLNLSGGNDFVKYFTSVSYNYDGDIFDLKTTDDYDPRTYQKRYNWRSNLDFNFSKTTKLTVRLSGDFRDWNGNAVTAGVPTGYGWGKSADFRNIFVSGQIGAPLVLSNGELGIAEGTSSPSTIYGKLQRTGQVKKRSNRMYSDFILKQNITKNLSVTGKVSFNYQRNYESAIKTTPIYFYADLINQELVQAGDLDLRPTIPTNSSEDIKGFSKSLYYDFRVNYDKKFGQHDIGLLALFLRREDSKGIQFPYREESWVGRFTYAFNDKYLLEFNGAYNGNENWAPGLKFGFFPSISAGWNISEEAFMKDNLPFIEFMKLRYSYGIVGNANITADSRFQYIPSYESGSSVFYGDGPAGTSYGSLFWEGLPANARNTWEEAVKQNIGIDMTFLNGRLSTEIDLFDEHRTAILMPRRRIPSWYGNSSPYANLGETKNHGFDASVKFRGKINNDLSYNLSANLSMSENRIINRDDPPGLFDYQKQANTSIGEQRGQIGMGYMQSWDDVYNSPIGSGGQTIRPGDYRLLDFNADGEVNSEDSAPVKTPSYAAKSFAFSTGLAYENLSFHAMFNGVFGVSKRIHNDYFNTSLLTPEAKDYWTPTNPNPQRPAPGGNSGIWNGRNNTFKIFDSSFIRLRSLELKYKLGQQSLGKLKYFSKMEMYISGMNLITWTSLTKAFDPESAELQAYPIAKTYNIGLRFSL